MKVEEARKIAATKIEELAQELQRGQSETLRAYLAAMAKFPLYSVNNMLLIVAQFPLAKQVCGLSAWNRLGRYVREGEHGIAILAPIVQRRKQTDAVAETSDADETVVGFRSAFVFDVSQTEGCPIADFAAVSGDPGPYTDRLTAFAIGRGIKLEYSRQIAPALGACIGDAIVLLPGLPAAEEFSTLVHEAAHLCAESGYVSKVTNAGGVAGRRGGI